MTYRRVLDQSSARSTASINSTSHTLSIDTNSSGGFTATVSGNTLESGVNDINALGASATVAAVGIEQFGINLVANTTPAIGLNPAGSAPIGSAANQYNIVDSFAFNKKELLFVSAKTGKNVRKVLEAVIERVPSPKGKADQSLRALIFDSFYDGIFVINYRN